MKNKNYMIIAIVPEKAFDTHRTSPPVPREFMSAIEQVKLFSTGFGDRRQGGPRRKLYNTHVDTPRSRTAKLTRDSLKNTDVRRRRFSMSPIHERGVSQTYLPGKLTFDVKETWLAFLHKGNYIYVAVHSFALWLKNNLGEERVVWGHGRPAVS